jgi:sulfide:quinone oxidoreductase
MRITVIGAGFAALTAVKTLRKQSKSANITVIAPQAKFVYLPSLIWLPAGLRKAENLRVELSKFFKKMNVTFVAGHVQSMSDDGRQVHTETETVDNDALIVACGGRFIKKLPGIEHVLTPCEGIQVGETIGKRLAAMTSGTIAMGFGGNPNEPAAMRGGPMFEFVFNIDTLLRKQGRRDQFKLVFFNPKDKPGLRLGPDVPGKLMHLMHKKGVETHLGHKIKGFTQNSVITEGGNIAADLILFMPGMTGPAWLENTDLPQSPGGMISANEHTQVDGFKHVYVAGDAGSFPGPEWQPKQAHAADIQAKVAVTNALRMLHNENSELDKIYHELLCIIDTLSHGIFIKRNDKGSSFLPPLRIMHYAKRFFEKRYLRQYRG